MSDIADISSNAIIRPGLPARWRWLPADDVEFNQESRWYLKAFGKIELAEDSPQTCCGALLVPNRESLIPRRQWWRATFFFDRDASEANVFVFDPYARSWFRRGSDWIESRRMGRRS